MGQIGNGLDGLLEFDVSDFIDKQCQQDRCGEGKDEGQAVEHQRVAQNVGEGGVVEKFSEIFQPDPICAGDGGEDVVVLESNDDAIHGDVAENEAQDQSGPDHGLHLKLVGFEKMPPGLPANRCRIAFRVFERHCISPPSLWQYYTCELPTKYIAKLMILCLFLSDLHNGLLRCFILWSSWGHGPQEIRLRIRCQAADCKLLKQS